MNYTTLRGTTLDVQLSRELIYENDPVKIPERGIEYWLGDRAPKLY